MSTAKRLHYDYAEYLASLAMSDLKLEFCDGVIYAMAGGTRAHAQLSAAVIGTLHGLLPRDCRLSTSDLKVRIEASDLSTFPDASVVCGDPVASPIDANSITNPVLIVEVTSKSTEDYDRGEKLSHYKQLGPLNVVLFVSHRTRRITCVTRSGSGWRESEHRSGEAVTLDFPALTFAVDAIYEGIALDVA